MPPFITHNGQTGYFQNGVFMPMSKQQYDMQFGNNPFVSAQQPYTQQQVIPQGVIQPPMAGPLSNEQKISLTQGDATTTDAVNKPIAQNNQFINNNASVNNNPYIQPMQDFGSIMAGQMYKFNNPNFTAQSQVQKRVNNISQPAPESELLQSAADAAQNVTTNSLQNTPSGVLANAATNAATSNAATVTDPILQNMGKGPGEFFQDQMQNANNAAANATQATSDGLDGLGFSGKWKFSPGQAFSNSKNFFGSQAGQATSAGISAGLGIATSLIGANASKYDQRVGMSKPNAFNTIAGDSTVTQIGLNPALMGVTGGLSAVAGLGIDLVKNIVKYNKQKDRYENKKLATDTMQSIDDARENMKPDYTGYARSGTQVNPYLQAQGGTQASAYSWGTGYQQPTATKLAPQNKEYAVGTTVPSQGGYFISKDPINNPLPTNTKSNIKVNTPTAIDLINNMATSDGLDEKGNYIYYDKNPEPLHSYGKPLKEIQKEAISDLTDIYTSPGYKEKLINELVESKKLGYGQTYNYSNEIGDPYTYTSYDANKTADDIIRNRLNRLKTPVSFMDQNDELIKDTYGYMSTLPLLYNRTKIKMNPEMHYGFPKSTLIEEFEHAAHVKDDMNWSGYNRQNITPYAKYLMDTYAPATSIASKSYTTENYMDKYTEKMAKKRAAEQYLIDNKQLKPGEKVTLDHYNYLYNNYDKMPKNAKELLNMTSENENVNFNSPEFQESNERQIKSFESNQTKEYSNHKEQKEYIEKVKKRLKKTKKSQENFLMIMNGIAMSLNNPYMPTARFGTYINPGNKNNSTNALDKKIKCSCGWSWNKSDGGSDPYKCHKCGNNNK
jgi:hypothetical protein